MHTWYGHMVSTHGKHTWYPHMVCTHGRQAVCVCAGRQAGNMHICMLCMYAIHVYTYLTLCVPGDAQQIHPDPNTSHPVSTQDDQGAEISAHSFGVKCDHSYWGSDMSQVMWHVRWTQKGLMPVKPAVHLTNRVSLPAGRALLLKSESS